MALLFKANHIPKEVNTLEQTMGATFTFTFRSNILDRVNAQIGPIGHNFFRYTV